MYPRGKLIRSQPLFSHYIRSQGPLLCSLRSPVLQRNGFGGTEHAQSQAQSQRPTGGVYHSCNSRLGNYSGMVVYQNETTT